MGSLLRQDDRDVCTLTLNRPEVRNAIHLEMLQALREAFESIGGDPGVRCVVLAGAGQAFCAGGDVKLMLERRGQALATADRLRGDLAGLLEAMASLDQPIIAKVHGDAVGAGLGLALACDIVVASEHARFGAPFAQLGLVPDTALTFELPRRMGLAWAKELVLTGALLSAQEAQKAGLVNHILPASALDDHVAVLAAKLAEMPTPAMGLAKRALQLGVEGTRGEALEREAYLQGLCFTTPEHAEGVQAFLEKRRADFRKA
jgi:2-(1,2-epoxy-1,2-dihydrophenyl)acetyl-CoA isomerase